MYSIFVNKQLCRTLLWHMTSVMLKYIIDL